MSKSKAKEILAQVCDLIFTVEREMDINKSNTRKLGYHARIAVANFAREIKNAHEMDLKDIL